MGVPFEFRSKSQIKCNPCTDMVGWGTWNQEPGTWSDDGQMIMNTLQSIVTCRGINLRNIADQFICWRDYATWTPHGVVFDIGGCTSRAISNLKRVKDVTKAGPASVKDNGNGSLMRILPVCLVLSDVEDDRRRKIVSDVSAMTHGHARARLACMFYSDMITRILQSKGDACIGYAHRMTIETMRPIIEEAGELEAFSRVLDPYLPSLPESEIRGSGYVIHSLEAAIWCGRRATCYKDGVLAAINLGEDTDTTGCIAGGLLGAMFSRWHDTDIPREWEDELAQIDMIDQKLASMKKLKLW